jgi:hypothetical protein
MGLISNNVELPERSTMSRMSQEQAQPAPRPIHSQQVSVPASKMTEGAQYPPREVFDREKAGSQLPAGAIVLLVGIFLSGALTGKALSASRRARRAESSAKSWERAVLALAGNNRKANNFPQTYSRQSSALRDTGNSETISKHDSNKHVPSWAEKKVYNMIGAEEKDSDKKIKEIASELWRVGKDRLPASFRRDIDRMLEQLREGAATGQKEDMTTSSNVNNTFANNNKSLYSAIHPHEDWDWTPADHPRPRKPWQKSRLPPWSVGFTSTPKAQESISKSTANSISSPDAQCQNFSESWRPFETFDVSESEFIAEEVRKDHSGVPLGKKTVDPKTGTKIRESIKKYSEGAAKRDQVKRARIEDVALRRKMIEQKLLEEEEKRKRLSESEIKSKVDKHRTDKRMQRVDLLIRIQEIRSKKAKQSVMEAEEAKARMQERVRRIKEKSEAFFKQRDAAMMQAEKPIIQEKPKDSDLPEINDIIQRQMWALMARAEALENKIRRFDSQHFFK